MPTTTSPAGTTPGVSTTASVPSISTTRGVVTSGTTTAEGTTTMAPTTGTTPKECPYTMIDQLDIPIDKLFGVDVPSEITETPDTIFEDEGIKTLPTTTVIKLTTNPGVVVNYLESLKVTLDEVEKVTVVVKDENGTPVSKEVGTMLLKFTTFNMLDSIFIFIFYKRFTLLCCVNGCIDF